MRLAGDFIGKRHDPVVPCLLINLVTLKMSDTSTHRALASELSKLSELSHPLSLFSSS